MLIGYKFKNFTSFRDNVEFSMLAPKTKVKNRFADNYVSTEVGGDILKSVVIVGENAGGKSNFVRSLQFLQHMLNDSQSVASMNPLVNMNNRKEKCDKLNNTLQYFEIEFGVKQNQCYKYTLEINYVGMVKEELSISLKPGGKYTTLIKAERKSIHATCIDDREGECDDARCELQIKGGYEIEIEEFDRELEKQLIKMVNTGGNPGLFITKLSLLGYEHAIIVEEWIKNSLLPITSDVTFNLYAAIKNEEKDIAIMKDKRYLDIFRMVDYSIKSIEIDEERPFIDSVIIRKNRQGELFKRKISMDSSGVIEFFAWAVTIFKVVYEDKVVLADEMDKILNPILSDRVLAYINGTSHRGQFIFTTHNIFHLDLKKFMKEQIYFITKDSESLESEMYSLSDFPEIRYETTKIYEFYMKGILGGTASE